MGDKERLCLLPEGQGVAALQGDPVLAANQPDPQLRSGAGAHCMIWFHNNSEGCFFFLRSLGIACTVITFHHSSDVSEKHHVNL